MKQLLLATLGLIALACGFSPPTHYYSLTPVEANQPLAVSGPPLQIFHVGIPAVLDRESLVEWIGQGELKISDTKRWAAPLDGMIQSVLAADLRQKLPGLMLLPGEPVPPRDSRGIVVNIRHFAPQDAQRVVLLADWSLISGQPPAPILTRSEAIDLPISSSRSSEIVSAMSRAIAVLSERIADTICVEGHVVVLR